MADAEGVQQELQEYLQKKGINTLFINLVESLLLAKPENPIAHIIQYLQSNYPDQATAKQARPKEVDPATPQHGSASRCRHISCGIEQGTYDLWCCWYRWMRLVVL